MPESMGMDVGKIMLPAEVAKPIRDAVRVHGRTIIPNKHIGGVLPTVTVKFLPSIVLLLVNANIYLSHFPRK